MNSLLFPLIRTLSDQRFHSGEEIAVNFNVSRGTVNNLIKQVRKMGLEIHAVKGRGYRMARPVTWLETAQIRKVVEAINGQITVRVEDHVDSTNTRLLEESRSGRLPAILCAEYQTGGRGRRGRRWAAAPGGSLSFSISWQFDRPIGELGGLSLAIGLALIRGISKHARRPLELKWPNDIVAGYRKLAGILVELQGEATGPAVAVIGVGVNLALPILLRTDISQGVVDLEELGWTENRNGLLADCIVEIISMLEKFNDVGFSSMVKEWNEWHAYQSRRVSLLLPDGNTEAGKVCGVDEFGALLIEQDNAHIRRFSCGEVSLRPVHTRPDL
jgi:BirA family biotin operon repressor/biotin-[acetyl-CoA-carboxylase] ligase